MSEAAWCRSCPESQQGM